MNMITGCNIRAEKLLCSVFRVPNSNCELCQKLCPQDAVGLSDKGPEISDRCDDCGVCFAACPNGAFRIEGRDDKSILNEIKDTMDRNDSNVFSISCTRGDSSSDLILPCLGRLSEALLLEPVRAGVAAIEILQPPCPECPSVKGAGYLTKTLLRTRQLFEMIGLEKEAIRVKNIALQPFKEIPEKSLSRRFFLGSIGVKAMQKAASAIPGLGHEGDKKKETFREALVSRPENSKRVQLLELLKEFTPKNTITIAAKDAILAEITVNKNCTACGTCATLCPTGAIIRKETESSFYLDFRAAKCTNCRLCLKTCASGAIRMNKEVLLNHLFDETEATLFEASKKECFECGAPFIDGDSHICPLCFDRSNKQNKLVHNLVETEI
jgi:energy-converting hydrogenase B subunit K